ncbi:arylamine N-acetyltransferase family protein [Saccharomonospora iraqiensis]|uniref:arylamine N-acetyltransferase family protein n=1 Tax=Saccharomonospora iraqiensis TaxID=52698 RepID=UPI000402EA33|nr:arylamine N-acetyltransferase [Saccharomonospora iraqiensis]
MTTTAPTPAPTDTDEWGVDALDLDAYLARIGFAHTPAAPSTEGLRALHEAHVRTIPFENLDVVLGRTPGLDLESITAKLVHRPRGGYCYEHALLFAAVLARLGYPVVRGVARVRPDHPGPQTHVILLTRVDGVDHLVDVGFGSGVLHPMPLRDGHVVDQAGWPHRLRTDGRTWRLEQHTDDGWKALHAFDTTPQHPVDYTVGNHYIATHPDSPFTGRPVVMRLEPGRCRRLVGTELHTTHPDGRPAERVPVPPEQLDETLRELDITLDPDELSRLRDRLGG